MGTSFAWIATTIAAASFWPSDFFGTQKMAYTAAAIGFFTFALGWVVAGFLPEPQFADHEGNNDSNDKDIEEEETTAPSSSADDESADSSDSDDEPNEKPV